ncbi:putative adaptor protein complex AP-3, delta subunit [Dioscorea sansibarensis]
MAALVDTLLQRSLDDLIKSLRSQPTLESSIISRSVSEIRREIRSTDPLTKSTALQKLSYLSSLHFLDISWSSFHSLELLPSSSFTFKRLAYLSASFSFHPASDLLLLATNQLRKDLSPSSPSPVISLALDFLCLTASPDLARDLTPEVHSLLSSPNPSIRAKATATALRIFTRYPDSVRVAFKRLVDNIDSSAAIGVFCELSASDPKPYLPLAPDFYRLLVGSTNNWILIKVLKIFARLAPLEPRLGRRIVDPVCEHLRRSNAKSLVLECARTVALSLADYDEAVRLAVEKVGELLASEDDANLRYLGLHVLSMLGPRHSWAVEMNKELVVKSLSDPDTNIRREALFLIMEMLFESNVVEISMLLVGFASNLMPNPEFCNDILGAVLSACERNVYELVMDFDWYVGLLGEMSRNPHCGKGDEIERQLVDIGLRVKDARPELVRVARDLLIDPTLLGNPSIHRILSAAAWVSGEYAELLRNPLELLEALLQPRTNLLPTSVRAIYIQAVFKILTFCFCSYFERLEAGQMLSSLGNPIAGTGCQEESNASTVIFGKGDNAAVGNLDDTGAIGCKRDFLSGSVSSDEQFTHESVLRMLNLIETMMVRLSNWGEVEIQDRARSVICLIHMLQRFQVWNRNEEELRKDGRVSEFANLMSGVFNQELGPVSANAQKRVSIPDGLILKENLVDLTAFIGEEVDFSASVSTSFFHRSHHNVETGEESKTLTQSTSLLSEHRKRHELYYLPAGKDGAPSNDYPPANDAQLPVSQGCASEGLAEFTDQPLLSRHRKPIKPRPVVVKLDDGDVQENSALKSTVDLKDDSLSGAVCDVLLGNEDKPTKSQKKSSKSQRRKKDQPTHSEPASHLRESGNLVHMEHGSSSSKSGRHHGHSKEKQSSSQGIEDKEDRSQKNLTNSQHHYRKHKHRRHGDVLSNLVPQTPVIQDFLL